MSHSALQRRPRRVCRALHEQVIPASMNAREGTSSPQFPRNLLMVPDTCSHTSSAAGREAIEGKHLKSEPGREFGPSGGAAGLLSAGDLLLSVGWWEGGREGHCAFSTSHHALLPARRRLAGWH